MENKKSSILLDVRKMLIKITIKYHNTPIRMYNLKKNLNILSINGFVEQV
jgi:hypothetical protein